MSLRVPGRKPSRSPASTGQDDAADFLLLQGLDGLGHCQVGLAGTGRTDPEDHGVGVDRVHIVLLVQRLGPDGLPTGGEDVGGQHFHGVLQRLAAQQGDELLQHGRSDDGASGHQPANLVEQAHDARHVGGRTADRKLVAPDMEIDGGELVFDEP